ncbi:hypothetical protein Ctob_013591 [Chrysochromulina tobinii]|jgi:hypothetical protein|uniref:Uncharacterized protein n=1 Tax=Chrysochromulina tobinii TaxID=1460289 RepID=A0A0M0JPP8_9EUKA|nr:hypothetical protein Ctob_013591 [Chrysochromulina tobinii]|eukprot:KOO28556.1 hypothetical protein Ctob_013591 [Chrysochromulina sp. CCMP291]
MGCDIHLKLERCVYHVDSVTVAARVTLLVLAERSKHEQQPKSAFQHMSPELWHRCAKLVTVTNGFVDKWIRCPYADWTFTNEARFLELSSVFKQKMEIATEEQWASLFEEYEEEHGPFKSEDEKQDFKWEHAHEVYAVATEAVQPSNCRQGELADMGAGWVPGSGFWDDCIGELESRHYNRFGLFSQSVGSVRSDPSLLIQQLGCVRSGWPADVNEDDAPDIDDANLHSHCCSTLAGLFAVDWQVSVSSTSRSARALKPAGSFVATPYQLRKQQYARRVGLVRDEYGRSQEPSLRQVNVEAIFGLERGGAYPAGWDDMNDRQKSEATLEKIMEELVASGRVAAEDEESESADDDEADLADASERTTRRELMGEDLCLGFEEMKKRMDESGASPADFRLLICFDN